MKKTFVRALAAMLCLLMLTALLPVVSRADSPYTTLTQSPETKELATLRFPNKANLYTEKGKLPRRAEIKSSWRNGSIYFMPKPSEGYGVLGTVDTGTPVTILAYQNGLYFFMTDDGRMGWNGPMLFTKPETIDEDLSQPLGEGSALTGEDAKAVSEFIAKHKNGCAPNPYFYASQPVVVLKTGETGSITIRGQYCKGKYDFSRTDGESAEGEWLGKGFKNGAREVEFTAKAPGMSVFKFTNTRARVPVYVLVVVV